MNLTDLRIIVTGAARGMGRHFALRFAECGASVLAVDVAEEGLLALEEQAANAPGELATFTGSVTSEADATAMVEFGFEAFGHLNGLLNCAGIFRDGLLVKKDKATGEVTTMGLDQWRQVIDVDLTGPFLCARAVAAAMVERDVRPGVIVNISSVSRSGNRGQGNYSAAKAGLAADTKVWAEELARYGIRVGAVAPGFIETPMLQGMPPQALERILERVPLRRLGLPEEVFLAVKFIVECDYFTGRCLDVDGGLVL